MKRLWKYYSILCIVALVLVVLPLLIISFYNVPSADDFAWGRSTVAVWRQTHSFFQVLGQAFQETYKAWLITTGRYGDTFLATLSPGMFNHKLYFIGPLVTILFFVFSEFYFFKSLFRLLGCHQKWKTVILACYLLVLQILFIPSPSEGFFWYAGAVAYTFFHSLMMVSIAILLKLTIKNSLSKMEGKLCPALLILFSFGIAGGNWVTGLQFGIVYFLFAVISILQHSKRRRIIISAAALYYICFLLNALAPGTQRRQSTSEGLGIINSILLSFKEAFNYCRQFINLPVIVMLLLLIPVIWSLLKNCSFRFPLPGIVFAAGFCLFAALFSPTMYAAGSIGPWRVQNLYRINLYLFVVLLEIYTIGYIQHKSLKLSFAGVFQKPWVFPCYAVLGSLIWAGIMLYYGNTSLSSVSAYLSLKSGQAREYHREFEERLTLLQDPETTDAELAPYSVYPYVLYFEDVKKDPEHWINISVADFYGKDSVRLKAY